MQTPFRETRRFGNACVDAVFDAPIGIPAITLSSSSRANFHLATWKLPLHTTAKTFRNMKLRAPHDYHRYLLGTTMNQDPNLHLAIPPLRRSFCLSGFLLRAKSASTISRCGANILWCRGGQYIERVCCLVSYLSKIYLSNSICDVS